MIEVESKAKINDSNAFRIAARSLGRFVGKQEKIDDYYTLEKPGRYPKKSLRIRKRQGHYEINFKHSLGYQHGVHAKKETEFIVKDVNDFLAVINEFGFRKWLRKEKTTELYEIGKNFHIELNNVKGLGWFVEVEYLADEQHIAYARKKVEEVLVKLGIKKNQIIKPGYTKMLWDKRH